VSYYEEEEYANSKFDVVVWKKIFSYIWPYKKHIMIGLIAVSALAVTDVLYPLMNVYAIEQLIETNSLDKLPMFIAFYIFFILLTASMVYVFIMQAGQIQRKLSFVLREKAFKRLHELPFSYYDKTPVGWIMARMTSDSRNLSEILSWGLIDLTWGLFMMFGITVVMFIWNFKLALIVLSVIPVLIVVSIYFRKKILYAYRKIRKENSKITGLFNEGIMGAKTTKTLVLEEENFNDFDKLTNTMKNHSIRAGVFAGLYFPTILFIASVATGLAYYYGGLAVLEGVMDYAILYLFLAYIGMFFEPVMQLANILARFQQAQASAERLLSLIEQEAEIFDSPEVVEKYGDSMNFKKENWEELIGAVKFDDVTFKYNKGEEVLTKFNLDVKAGESIANRKSVV